MNFSAIVTASWRRPQLFETLRVLGQCLPPPQEILLHVDGGNHELLDEVRGAFPQVRLLDSIEHLGPGGARNRLLAAAQNEWVASFDDDSHPFDSDFFAKAERAVRSQPAATLIACRVFEPGTPVPESVDEYRRTTDFVGCGCIYRREVFLQTSGYVPLRLAYGMEEVDLSLRYFNHGHAIVLASSLRVIHNTDPDNRGSPAAVSASIANIILRAWLRYPWLLLPLGLVQCLHRMLWLAARGFEFGISDVMAQSGALLADHGHERATVRVSSLIGYHLRRYFGWPKGSHQS